MATALAFGYLILFISFVYRWFIDLELFIDLEWCIDLADVKWFQENEVKVPQARNKADMIKWKACKLQTMQIWAL